MPAEIRPPLTVVFSLPDGVTYERRLDDLPDQVLAGDLARALVTTTHPHGLIRTQSVAMPYVQTLRRMARDLHVAGFADGIAALTPALIVQYWLTCDFHRERRIRAVLTAYASAVGRCIRLSGRTCPGGGSTPSSRASPTLPTAIPSGADARQPAPRRSRRPTARTASPGKQPNAAKIDACTA